MWVTIKEVEELESVELVFNCCAPMVPPGRRTVLNTKNSPS